MPRKKEFIEEVVLEKAMYTFWKKGYNATSVRDLEKSMGINQFSIYSTFKNKHKLFLSTLHLYQEINNRTLLRSLMDSDGDLKDIKFFFEDYVYQIKAGDVPNTCFFANTLVEADFIAHKSDNDKEELEIILKQFYNFYKLTFRTVLELAQAEGKLNEEVDTETYSEFLLGGYLGVSNLSKIYDKAELDKYIKILLKSIN